MKDYIPVIEAYFTMHNVHYEKFDETALYVPVSGVHYRDLDVMIHYDGSILEDGITAFCTTDCCFEENYEDALELCNEVNRTHTFLKFYIDEDCNLAIESNSFVSAENCGEVALEIVKSVGVAWDAFYNQFQKVKKTKGKKK